MTSNKLNKRQQWMHDNLQYVKIFLKQIASFFTKDTVGI